MATPSLPLDLNLKGTIAHLKEQADIAVKNNVAHATATTNTWRMAVTQIATAASALAMLAFQSFSGDSSVPGLLKSINATATLNDILHTLTNMKLVFDTPARQKALRDAVAAVKECHATISDLEIKPSGAAPRPAPAAAPHHAAPKQAKQVQLNPDGSEPMPVLKGTSIKPTTFLTFSSAESSASARLGVMGYCAICNAQRAPNSQTCPSCGNTCNILLG